MTEMMVLRRYRRWLMVTVKGGSTKRLHTIRLTQISLKEAQITIGKVGAIFCKGIAWP